MAKLGAWAEGCGSRFWAFLGNFRQKVALWGFSRGKLRAMGGYGGQKQDCGKDAGGGRGGRAGAADLLSVTT